MENLSNNDLLEINGGANGWKIAGGILTIGGSIIGGIASGGSGVVPAVGGVIGGIAMIGDGLNDD